MSSRSASTPDRNRRLLTDALCMHPAKRCSDTRRTTPGSQYCGANIQAMLMKPGPNVDRMLSRARLCFDHALPMVPTVRELMQPVVVVRRPRCASWCDECCWYAPTAAAVVPRLEQIAGLITPEDLLHRERSMPLGPGTVLTAGDLSRSDVVAVPGPKGMD